MHMLLTSKEWSVALNKLFRKLFGNKIGENDFYMYVHV